PERPPVLLQPTRHGAPPFPRRGRSPLRSWCVTDPARFVHRLSDRATDRRPPPHDPFTTHSLNGRPLEMLSPWMPNPRNVTIIPRLVLNVVLSGSCAHVSRDAQSPIARSIRPPAPPPPEKSTGPQ